MRNLIALFAGIITSIGLSAQQYQFKNYSVADGLGQSQVFDIAQTPDGFVWFATQGGGLSRTDGLDFESFTTQQGLPSNYVHSLLVQDSVLWVGTSQGLAKWDGASIQFVIESEGLSVADLAYHSKTSSIFLATNKGLKLWDGNTLEAFPVDLSVIGSLYAVSINKSGDIWIGGNTGLMACTDGICQEYTQVEELNAENIRCIYTDPADRVWIGTYGKGINLFQDGKLLDPSDILGLSNARVHDIWSDESGIIWFATQHSGIVLYNPLDGEVHNIRERDGLANNHVRCFYQDDWNNYWIGTSGGGVSKYTGKLFNYLTTKQGLNGDYIYSLAQFNDHSIFVGNSGRGLQVLDSNKFKDYPLPLGLAKSKIKAITFVTDSVLWLGTDGDGLWLIQPDTHFIFNTENGLRSNFIRDLCFDDEKRLWIATAGGGLHRVRHSLDDSTFTEIHVDWFGPEYGMEAERINTLLPDPNGRLWYGSLFEGIGLIQKDKVVKTISKENGLADNNVNSMCFDDFGNLWVGTVTNGLSRIQLNKGGESIQNFSAPENLASNIVYQLAYSNGALWVGSEKGVEKITLNEVGEPIERELFNQEDGFLGVETTLNASLVEKDGTCWFGTINGLSSCKPTSASLEIGLPRVSIGSISVNAEPVLESVLALKTLSYDSNILAFTYRAISQGKPKSVRYQTKLIGLEEEWSEPTKNQSINYSNLPSGNYSFAVRASTNLQDWSSPKSVSFKIEPPFWQTRLFIIITVVGSVLFLSLIGGLIYLNVRRRVRRRQQQLILEKEMIQLEQKALRLQMNPHFIFNALNSIQALVSSSDTKSARYYLAKFSKLMRQILDNSRRSKISLENEIATLENYLAIEQFCHNNRFEFELEVDDELDIESIEIPPIMVQPFVENAIIHGVSQKESGGKVLLAFRQENDVLICSVQDNGIGRSAAAKMKSQQDQHHKSTALLITQERLDRLGKSSQESIEIIDLTDEGGNAIGTKVILRVPL